MNEIRINGERLWSRLMEMATHGALPGGGCNRQALTDEDRAGRELFMQWCRDIGCEIRMDAVGNIFARRAGSDATMPPVITGSHLDTQPSGGKFDGVYGVLAGLEVLHTLHENDVTTLHPLEVVVWTNEEGCRFDTAMMGSAVWSGKMPLDQAYALTDREGRSVREELERIGHLGSADTEPVHAALELHIEQGPVLEAEGKTIGIVTGVQHMSRHRIVIHGQEAHAGPTPMEMRRDPVMALSRILPELYALAAQHGPDGRVTFGFLEALPGSSNTVPGRLELTVDIRHPLEDYYREMLSGYQRIVEGACSALQLDFEMQCFWEAPGVEFDTGCIAAVREATLQCKLSGREMVSGAGHDACNVSTVAPTSMIFIPCEGGLSHNEAENTLPQQAAAGANVLLGAMLQLAAQDGGRVISK
ncbi:MAG: hydantoinase/carbamoylase family amidase [Haliea sp.]|nr:hydantoinase/carbamoylase family amidase [Haliea sp.]